MSKPIVDYLAVEVLAPAEFTHFILGRSRLGRGRLGTTSTGGEWIDVTCHLQSVSARSGGRQHAASTAIEGGYMQFIARNDLDPTLWPLHPGLPLRLRDTNADGDGILWRGTLDDIVSSYEKGSDDYHVRITGTDGVRELKAVTVRGQPGALDADTTTDGRFDTRVEQLADRAGLSADIDLPAHAWNFGTVTNPQWQRFGSTPFGYDTGLVDYEDRVYVRDSIRDTLDSVNVTAGAFGMRLTRTGLTPGQLYQASVVLGLFNTFEAGVDPDHHTFTLRADTGDIGIPVAAVHNGRRRRARATVTFRATATVHQIDVYRDYTGQLHRQGISYELGDTRFKTWTGEPEGIRPIQPVAYESSAYNHLVMAADSVGIPWTINADGEVAVALPDTSPVATFSDEHDVAGPHLCFTEIDAGYNTADVVNVAEIDNHGRRPSIERFDEWIVADEQLDFARESSIDTYRARPISLHTSLALSILPDRIVEIFDEHDTPASVVRAVTVDAIDQPAARSIRTLDTILVEYRGNTHTCLVTGIEHTISPRLHRITYQLKEYTP